MGMAPVSLTALLRIAAATALATTFPVRPFALAMTVGVGRTVLSNTTTVSVESYLDWPRGTLLCF